MTIKVAWRRGNRKGKISVENGSLANLALVTGNGEVARNSYSFADAGEATVRVEVENSMVRAGANSTVVSVMDAAEPFSFFLRDVNADYPIYLEEYGVIVTTGEDPREYEEVVRDAVQGCGYSRLEATEAEPEESFQSASQHTRRLPCVTWLGLSRDIKIFEVGFRGITYRGSQRSAWDWIRPRFHGFPVRIPELGESDLCYDFFAGRGLGCEQGLVRWLLDGDLPILKAVHTDDDIVYTMTFFVTLERSPLVDGSVRGTHILVADAHSRGSMLTPEHQRRKDDLLEGEMERDEEPVIYLRIETLNIAAVPRYSWMRFPVPSTAGPHIEHGVDYEYDGSTGLARFSKDRVFLAAACNGAPAPQTEMSVLLAPGEKADYVFRIPHRPISEDRARRLAETDFTEKLEECAAFWRSKLARGASVSIPEKRIDEMIRAGVNHLDLVCYGNEPDGAVAPVVGVYSPIGSESSPIIQFLDCMGRTDLARRAIMYFIEKQHDDGFMQNFGEYMLETGAVLWNIGEHFRYTRDHDWIRSIHENIVRACDYLIRWRRRNQTDELRGRGYGMIEGKVADPEDPYHSYMLNGFAYLGLQRSSEVLQQIDPEQADLLREEAQALKNDIRGALARSLAEAPVVPLGNGRWIPSVPPWVESRGPVSLHVEDRSWFTHATITARDALPGAMYLLLQEVVDPNERYGGFILESTAELFFLRNTAFSQPFYSPHPFAHIRRGEVKPFLKEFYTNVSSLADRETYTFWEHYHHASPHKTHEEGWFLMRCRWMLYMESADELLLLPGVPRAWLANGRRIAIQGMATYFGSLKLEVESLVDLGIMRASVAMDAEPERLPKRIRLRLPHPALMMAAGTSEGEYDPQSESVIVEGFSGSVVVELRF